jgi:hypothetical protein
LPPRSNRELIARAGPVLPNREWDGWR